jgi:hypothetical protein
VKPFLISFVVAVPFVLGAAPSSDLTLDLRDYLEFPITGMLDGKGQTDGMLARINSLREEPGGRRFFVNDLNGPLYIVDKATRRITTYLDFNGRDGRRGLFHKFAYESGLANGLNSFQFDPDYRTERKVLHRSHRGSFTSGTSGARQCEPPLAEPDGVFNDASGTDARSD